MIKRLNPDYLWQKYLKNIPDFSAVISRGYPRFIFDNRVRTLIGQIPVFTFHSVEWDLFESQVKYLAHNGYRTLAADEFLAILAQEIPTPERALLLTFDDGWKSLWSVAYPLLKRYGLKAVAFIIPGMVGQDHVGGSDHEAPGRNHSTAYNTISDPRRLCTWAELRAMQESGVIDIQSHSLNHARVFVSSSVVDFLSVPKSEVSSKMKLAVYRESGVDRWDRTGHPGMPIYESRSLLAGLPRYFDDESLRETCIRHVMENGGPEYLSRKTARREIFKIAREIQVQCGDRGRFQTANEMDAAMVSELEGSKRLIEEKIPGHRVDHFCYPWWKGCERASELSKQIGYVSNFWGRMPRRPINRPGDDPFHIVRLRENYLFRLPGDGRRSLLSLLTDRSQRHRSQTT